MSRIALICAFVVGSVGPAMAQDFRAENRVTVRPGDGDFAVLGGGGQGAKGTWCAAADFSRDVLGARGADRIYVKTPRSRGTGKNSVVVFSLSSAGLTPVSVLAIEAGVRRAGTNLSVVHAGTFCADARLISR